MVSGCCNGQRKSVLTDVNFSFPVSLISPQALALILTELALVELKNHTHITKSNGQILSPCTTETNGGFWQVIPLFS